MKTSNFLITSFLLILFFESSGQIFLFQKKHRLEGKNIRELEIIINPVDINSQTLNSQFYVIIKAKLQDADDLVTEGAGKGKVKWDNYSISVEGGSFNNGIVTVTGEALKLKDHSVIVTAKVTSNPNIIKSSRIPISYVGRQFADFRGPAGQQGSMGRSGQSGESNGSVQKGNPGQEGERGGDGRDGGAGQDVKVYIKKKFDAALEKDLMQVCVVPEFSKVKYLYLLDAKNGHLVISVDGGVGGSGGQGGYGGRGGSGQVGGSGGNGGAGGTGGNGGSGGQIVIFCDPSAKHLLSLFTFSNNGGLGGNAGYGGGGGSAGPYNSGGAAGVDGKTGRLGINGQAGISGPPLIIHEEIISDID